MMIAHIEKLHQRPLMILTYGDSLQAARNARHFRRHGWEVHLASTGTETRRLCHLYFPAVVVLDTELKEESGWLTCAKLASEQPDLKIVLVASAATAEDQRMAEFVGAAALVSQSQGIYALADELLGNALSAVG